MCEQNEHCGECRDDACLGKQVNDRIKKQIRQEKLRQSYGGRFE